MVRKQPKDFVTKLSNGKVEIVVEPFVGLHTVDTMPTLVISGDRHTKDYMDTTFHEVLHNIFPDLSEAEIVRAAGDLTEVAWKMGYRLPRS